MSRPTYDELEITLRRYPPLDEPSLPMGESQLFADARVLAAEVRAMREERERMLNATMEEASASVRQLRATIARIEAYAAGHERRNGDREKCWLIADELRALLKETT